MQKTEQQILEEELILNWVFCVKFRVVHTPEEWHPGFDHKNPHGSFEEKKKIPTTSLIRTTGYSYWLREAVGNLSLDMDAYDKEYRRFKGKKPFFKRAAKLAYKIFKMQYGKDFGNPKEADEVRQTVAATVLEIDWLLREHCGFRDMLENIHRGY